MGNMLKPPEVDHPEPYGPAAKSIHIDPDRDSVKQMTKSLRDCLQIVNNLNGSKIKVTHNGKMLTSEGDITIRVGGQENRTIYGTFADIAKNGMALRAVVELLLHQWEQMGTTSATPDPLKKQSPINQSSVSRNLGTMYEQAMGLVKENHTLKRKVESDTRQRLVDEFVTQMKRKGPRSDEQLIQQLLDRNAELTDRLAAEMNSKVAANERSLENISIPNRPMTVAEEYSLLNSNAWLGAKNAMDARIADEKREASKVQGLCNIIMEAERQAKMLFTSTMDSIAVHLNDPMRLIEQTYPRDRFLGRDTYADSKTYPEATTFRRSYKEELRGECGLPTNVLTAVGDYFRNTADYIDLDILYQRIRTQLSQNEEREKTTLSHLLCEPAVQRYLKQCGRLAWKMVIQRPPMRFDASGIGEPWKGKSNLEIAWNSDPHVEGATIRYYKYPSLFHGDSQMVKGSVFVN